MIRSMWKPVVLAAAVVLALSSGAARAQDYEVEHPYPNANGPHPHLQFGCWASHNGYSCGSLQSEGTFIFGSCRQFFGDPCLKGPPPPPWTPEGAQPPDPTAPNKGKRGCNCGGW
ncbi:MAG TPA: hypothetical protein VMS17_15890 [Gemmataceae bacterium]|nr:hypothetical protein [Gemmataceae bacterium]